MKEKPQPIDSLTKISAEFDQQMAQSNPFELMRKEFSEYSRGPVMSALGAVGGNGAGAKAMGILEQFKTDGVPFIVVVMRKYLGGNPLVASYLESKSIKPLIIEDEVSSIAELYQNCYKGLEVFENRVSGILSLGPRTYYPETARRLDLPALIIDGAVPDKWDNTTNASGTPNTEYYQPAYLHATYATTCGFTGWQPPPEKYPRGMDLRVIAQPFSKQKISFLRKLRNCSPGECRQTVIESGEIENLDDKSILIIPTMDQVYLNPDVLSVFGNFLLPEQLGQAYGFMAELITSLYEESRKTGQKFSLYLPPGVMCEVLSPLIATYKTETIKIIRPKNSFVPNETWLMLRKAGVAIGRAPLCVSTAEALGMANFEVIGAIPGRTSDGISYMTEPEALEILAKKGVCRSLFPGEPIIGAVREVIEVKSL